LPRNVIEKVVEKFIFQLEAQLADRSVTIELTSEAAGWLAKEGYDEKFGARPLARVIQEHIKKPLAEELLFGKLENGGAVKVIVEGKPPEEKLGFEFFPADPKTKRKTDDDEDDDDDDDDEPQLIEAEARKAIAAPKVKKPRSKSSGTVPSVPPKKK